MNDSRQLTIARYNLDAARFERTQTQNALDFAEDAQAQLAPIARGLTAAPLGETRTEASDAFGHLGGILQTQVDRLIRADRKWYRIIADLEAQVEQLMDSRVQEILVEVVSGAPSA